MSRTWFNSNAGRIFTHCQLGMTNVPTKLYPWFMHLSLFHISKLSKVSKWHLPMVICHFVHQLPFPSKPKETSGSSRGQASLAPHYRPTEQSVRRCDGGRILRAPRFCASIRSSIFLILLGDI